MKKEEEVARVGPLTAGVDGQDLPRRGQRGEVTAAERPMRTPAQLVQEWREQTTYTPGDLYTDGRATAFARCADELELALSAIAKAEGR